MSSERVVAPEQNGGGESVTKVNRSAKSGRFVKKSTVKRHPDTTVTETVKRRKKK
jgi:hypothetical protein